MATAPVVNWDTFVPLSWSDQMKNPHVKVLQPCSGPKPDHQLRKPTLCETRPVIYNATRRQDAVREYVDSVIKRPQISQQRQSQVKDVDDAIATEAAGLHEKDGSKRSSSLHVGDENENLNLQDNNVLTQRATDGTLADNSEGRSQKTSQHARRDFLPQSSLSKSDSDAVTTSEMTSAAIYGDLAHVTKHVTSVDVHLTVPSKTEPSSSITLSNCHDVIANQPEPRKNNVDFTLTGSSVGDAVKLAKSMKRADAGDVTSSADSAVKVRHQVVGGRTTWEVDQLSQPLSVIGSAATPLFHQRLQLQEIQHHGSSSALVEAEAEVDVVKNNTSSQLEALDQCFHDCGLLDSDSKNVLTTGNSARSLESNAALIAVKATVSDSHDKNTAVAEQCIKNSVELQRQRVEWKLANGCLPLQGVAVETDSESARYQESYPPLSPSSSSSSSWSYPYNVIPKDTVFHSLKQRRQMMNSTCRATCSTVGGAFVITHGLHRDGSPASDLQQYLPATCNSSKNSRMLRVRLQTTHTFRPSVSLRKRWTSSKTNSTNATPSSTSSRDSGFERSNSDCSVPNRTSSWNRFSQSRNPRLGSALQVVEVAIKSTNAKSVPEKHPKKVDNAISKRLYVRTTVNNTLPAFFIKRTMAAPPPSPVSQREYF